MGEDVLAVGQIVHAARPIRVVYPPDGPGPLFYWADTGEQIALLTRSFFLRSSAERRGEVVMFVEIVNPLEFEGEFWVEPHKGTVEPVGDGVGITHRLSISQPEEQVSAPIAY